MSLDVPSDAWQPGQIRERFFTYARAILHPGVVRWNDCSIHFNSQAGLGRTLQVNLSASPSWTLRVI
jgi:hypothetical protein